jgi:hypothetical protein
MDGYFRRHEENGTDRQNLQGWVAHMVRSGFAEPIKRKKGVRHGVQVAGCFFICSDWHSHRFDEHITKFRARQWDDSCN